MAFSGKWIIKGKDIPKIHPLPLYLISEAVKAGLSCNVPLEFYIGEGGLFEIKESASITCAVDNRKEPTLNYFKRKIKKSSILKSQNLLPLKKPTSILLLFPYSIKDKRWLSMGIPPSLLFLSKALKSHYHSVKIKKIPLESEAIPDELENFSWVGVPLYDDLFIPVRKLIQKIKEKSNVKIAVGGPMATLSPLAVAVHLPEANLIIRGEAEETFPEVLSFLHDPGSNIEELLKFKGFLYRDENFLISSSFSEISIPNLKFSNLDIDSIPCEELEKGLEINTSRGCPRSCIYCSHVHGKFLRELPIENVKEWLKEFKKKIEAKGIRNPQAFTININDDDILLNEKRAEEIIKAIYDFGFKIWGIQTSLETIVEKKEILDFLSSKYFYYEEKPLIWLGTDSFIPERRKRLGRKPLNYKLIEEIINIMEEKEISNHHYLILSDHETDWREFVDEIIFILKLQKKYEYFEIIPTSKFIIPYPYTPSFKIIPAGRIEKEVLSIKDYPQFDYPLVKFAKPKNEYIFALLNPNNFPEIPLVGEEFINSLSERNYRKVLNILFTFLKLNMKNEINSEKRKHIKELIENLELKAQEFI